MSVFFTRSASTIRNALQALRPLFLSGHANLFF